MTYTSEQLARGAPPLAMGVDGVTSEGVIEHDRIFIADERIAAAPVQLFLRACLRGRIQAEAREVAHELARMPNFDWAAVDEAAGQQLLVPLLFRTLQGHDIVPPALEDAWRSIYFRSFKRNLLRMRELAIVLERLAAAGVTVILLKGVALAITAYDDPGTRLMDDVDLLLREADVPLALRELAALGYAAEEPFPYFGEVQAHKQGLLIADFDLHWSLVRPPHYQKLIPLTWPFATARPADVEGMPALVLGPEAQLLHMCAHLTLHHRGEEPELRRLYDIAAVLQCYRGEIDWHELLQRARSYDLVLSLQKVMTIVAGEWPVLVPAPFMTRLCRLQPSAQEVWLVRSLQAIGQSPSGAVWVELATLPSWRARLRYVGAHLLPTPDYMRRRYQIRNTLLLPLYYPARWVEGVAGSLVLGATFVARRAWLLAGRYRRSLLRTESLHDDITVAAAAQYGSEVPHIRPD